MRQLGRLMQVVALAVTPFALFLPKAEVFRFPGPELTMLLGMACLFGIGRIVEGYGQPS